ncbi:MAG: hypothetical protein Q8Q33_03365 [Chlamydiota bacterium]|nr:hypothetical protein [Chlamydiota bacterium]
MNIFRQRERQLDLEDDERELEEWRDELNDEPSAGVTLLCGFYRR